MEKLLEPLHRGAGNRDVLSVLSDALLEQGDPWGEAIRLSLQLEDHFPGEDVTIDGERRLRRLIAAHGPSWCVRIHGPKKTHFESYPRFFRAIPGRIDFSDRAPLERLKAGWVSSLDLLPEHGALSSKLLDQVTELTITPGAGTATTLQLGNAKNVTRLSVPWIGARTVEELKKAPCLSKLESLTLTSARAVAVSRPELEALLSLPLPKLNSLGFEHLQLGLLGAEALRDGMKWKLVRLYLDDAGLGVKGTLAFLTAKWLSALRVLSFAENAMGPVGAEALAAAPLLKLVSLDLTQTASAAKSLPPFFTGVKWPELRALSLNGCVLKGKALAPLAAAKLGGLRELRLINSLIGDDGLAELSKTKTLNAVRVLQLSNNAIKGSGVAALGKSALMKTVEALELSHNKFQNTGAKGLAASKNVGALRALTLGHNWLGVQGLKAILGNPAMKRFEQLHEGMNNYGTQLAKSFIDSDHLNLVTLRLGPETTTAVLDELLSSPRVGSLEWLEIACHAFGDPQAELLIKGPLGGKAKTLVLISPTWSNQLSDAGVKSLQAALGNRLQFT